MTIAALFMGHSPATESHHYNLRPQFSAALRAKVGPPSRIKIEMANSDDERATGEAASFVDGSARRWKLTYGQIG